MSNIRDEQSGMFRVFTESGSQYVVDLTGGTLCRETATHSLRGDTVAVGLVHVLSCVVGECALFVIQLPNVVGPTLRQTSVVTHILGVDDGEAA